MKLKQFFAAATLTAASACSFAIPLYTGDTDAPGYTGGAMDTGYYIWNDEDNKDSWHIRWTSTNATPDRTVDWFGWIEFHDSGLDTVTPFRFESNDSYLADYDSSYAQIDDLIWRAVTNDSGGVDGLDFTVGSSLSVLEFHLGSSLFSGLTEDLSEEGVASTLITIGDQNDPLNVNVRERQGRTYQKFQVEVSEPGSLALIGLGLVGLGLARRKQAKS